MTTTTTRRDATRFLALTTVDTAAETLPGIGTDLYAKLWGAVPAGPDPVTAVIESVTSRAEFMDISHVPMVTEVWGKFPFTASDRDTLVAAVKKELA